jgi:hypothetical protein
MIDPRKRFDPYLAGSAGTQMQQKSGVSHDMLKQRARAAANTLPMSPLRISLNSDAKALDVEKQARQPAS